MNSNLLTDFTVDREARQIRVERSFRASVPMVWAAWTTAELLDQWWAPQPFKNQTKKMDFREGGTWLYAMTGPNNERHWCRFDYESIEAQQAYSGLDAFCDEEGNINTSFSRMHWNNQFSAEGAEVTKVRILISVDTLETLEQIIAMGFKEGFLTGMNQLDAVLEQIKMKR
jgi:uncharacterized protein YndB with AHSA1/START domain